MRSEDVTIIQLVKGQDGGGKRLASLNDAQKAGTACVICAGTENLAEHVGYLNGHSVQIHPQCVGRWGYGD